MWHSRCLGRVIFEEFQHLVTSGGRRFPSLVGWVESSKTHHLLLLFIITD